MKRPRRGRVARALGKFLRPFEGFSSRAYLDPVGVPTQGWGHTDGVDLTDPPVSEEVAFGWLVGDTRIALRAVRDAVKVPLTTRQKMALGSLAYNIGASAFATSTLVRFLNAHNYYAAAEEFPRWVKGGSPLVTLPGLVRRRQAERRMFLSKMPRRRK